MSPIGIAACPAIRCNSNMLLPNVAPVSDKFLKLSICPSTAVITPCNGPIGKCLVKSESWLPPSNNSLLKLVATPTMPPSTEPKPLSIPPTPFNALPKKPTSSEASLVFLPNSFITIGKPNPGLCAPPPLPLFIVFSNSRRVLSEATFLAITSPIPGISIFTSAIY